MGQRSIDVRANMASICAIICDISAIEYWGQEFSVMALENGAVKQYNDIAGADSIGGAAVRQYSPPMVTEVGGEYVVLPC